MRIARRWRVIHWLAQVCSKALMALALLGFCMWFTGRVLSDRTVWSQWLSWIPTVATVAGMAVCVSGAWIAAWVARVVKRCWLASGTAPFAGNSAIAASTPDTTGRPGTPAVRGSARPLARTLAAVLTLGVGLYMTCWEWNLRRHFFPPPPPKGVPFTLLYWNQASNWSPEWIEDISRELRDITVLNAIRYWEKAPEVMEALAKDHKEHFNYQRIDAYAIISKWPILRWARTDLNLPTVQTSLRPYATVYERGWFWNRGGAAWIEFDTKDALGKNLVVWLVDMPSDPRLHRDQIARLTGERMRAWSGVAMERGAVGQFLAGKERLTGFPEPDLIFGDFNIPRGAQSLRHIVGDAKGSFEETGWLTGATYPKLVPLLGIDQIFTKGNVATVHYRVFDPGFGMHLAQSADLVMKDH